MLFFQTMLVGGYFYAHGIARYLSPRHQAIVHGLLLCSSLALLPIAPSLEWKPRAENDPTAHILLLLMAVVGGPYLLLASTGPLLQSWFSRTHRDRSPYPLYALSNVGSLLGLLTYPVMIEPLLPIARQTVAWSLGYVLFAAMCVLCSFDLRKLDRHEAVTSTIPESITAATSRPRPVDYAWWLGLSACGSIMLLATTNKMCLDVASIPFLWVVPLAIYLVSFIVVFGRDTWYDRRWGILGMIAAVFATVVVTVFSLTLHLALQIILLLFILAASCYACHGELARKKPSAMDLTIYFVTLAIGGALGGMFVALLAPLIFLNYYEFNVGLVFCLGMLWLLNRQERWRGLAPVQQRVQRRRTLLTAAAIALAAIGAIWGAATLSLPDDSEILDRRRNFYGAVCVTREGAGHPELARIVMTHGNTAHGVQFEDSSSRSTPTMYYTTESGVGLAILNHPEYLAGRSLNLGVVGLGAGTLACYARSGDRVQFYEIDPLVLELAERHFSFLSDARRRGADVDVSLGDARLVLERQTTTDVSRQFDVLVVDAFTSDSIPLHLLTMECLELYQRHLKPDGVLAFHISNRHLDLRPVIQSAARQLHRSCLWLVRPPEAESWQRGWEFASGSDWMLVTSNRSVLTHETIRAASTDIPNALAPVELTDDFSSLLPLLRW